MNPNILIVDDEPQMLTACKAALHKLGLHVSLENKPANALERLRTECFDLLITDVRMPGVSGIDILKAGRKKDGELPVIMITAFPDVDTAVEALRSGALDYLIKPFHPEDLRSRVARALEERRLKGENRLLARHVGKDYGPVDIVGRSAALRRVLDLVEKVAATQADVLILGESGTGKEIIARMLHAKSGRTGYFAPVDCGAIPEHLLENEFFGHEKGAYTGAVNSTPGLMEFADKGTFFLDEIGELPLPMQSKLLRALQEKQFRRVGGNDLRSVDICIVAATNKDLHLEVEEGRFREDLFYRLNVVAIHLPPLRERAEDIPLLVEHYLPRFAREMGRPVVSIEAEALDILRNYAWPGNIRELQNVLQKATVVCESEALGVSDLPEHLVRPGAGEGETEESFAAFKNRRLREFEKQFFEKLLSKYSGNAPAAAKAADMPESNFYWYLKKHDIKAKAFRH